MESYHITLKNFKINAFILIILFSFCHTYTKAQFLKSLIPDEAVAQHGGSIGYASAGFGYNFFKEDKGSLDFTYGYVPESKGGKLHIFAGKFSYKPIKIKVKDWANIYPLNPGVFISYHPAKQFAKWNKYQYPRGYYWWSKSIRYHASLSTEAKIKMAPNSKIEAIGIYSEFNTNDLYLVSWYKNQDSMPFWEIVKIGYGVRVYF